MAPEPCPLYSRARIHTLSAGNRRSTEMVIDPTLKSDEIRLVSIDKTNPVSFHANRAGTVGRQEWQDKVAIFERVRGGCAVCGQQQERYDKGHLSRAKGMVIDNIVPMCSGCNNHGQRYGFDYKIHPSSLKVRPVPQGCGGAEEDVAEDLRDR